VSQSAELRRQIEDMALQLIVGAPENGGQASAWLPVLEKISASAARERAEAVLRAAAELETGLRALASSSEPEAVSALLQEGVANLQKALDASAQSAATAEVHLAQDPELLSDFIVESREHLSNIESQLLTLERDPSDAEALNSSFRGFHTIKGLAGFLELWEVQKVAHEVETVLDRARNGEWTINPGGVDVILESADYLRRWLAHMEGILHKQATTAPPRDEALLARIARLTSEPDGGAAAGLEALAEAVSTGNGKSAEEGAGAGVSADVPAEPKEESAAPAGAGQQAAKRQETMAVKVDTGKLDYLVDMAGEMVIAESLVRHDKELADLKSPALHRKVAHLTRITAELQRTAMSMRLVPIGPLFRRMARMVRDLSRKFSKPVEMETQGDDIELDRTIVEELSDPLMHMVRNALDHGIEDPAGRQAAGKPATARVLLKANHQAGQVVIEVTDDGRGLDREKLAAKAIQRGLISTAEGMSDSEVFNLIFEPGFSTAAQVTDVSGRGVGMDVVRRHIEKMRGRIEIRSTLGQGSTFLLKLPLTLAIIDGLVVGVGQERYIVPLFAIREMFRPSEETIWTVQQRAEMALVRGALMPVVRLYKVFGVKPRTEDPRQGVLVVAEVEGRRFCVLVDELIGKQEVVIKSLGETFKGVTGVAGGAILGDGRVGLILDLDRLSKVKES
jgi:two-component system, chemotaxis family, sensor kinase CheA